MLLEAAHSGKCRDSIETGSWDWTSVFPQKMCDLEEISDIRHRGKSEIFSFSHWKCFPLRADSCKEMLFLVWVLTGEMAAKRN